MAGIAELAKNALSEQGSRAPAPPRVPPPAQR
jgi:hypothetical protein